MVPGDAGARGVGGAPPLARWWESGRLSVLLAGACFLLSLLRSRRTAPTMMATRPLIATMSLAPVLALAMPIARLRSYGGAPTVGAALALGALGVVLCWHAAAVFGQGMPDKLVKVVEKDDDD